MSKWGTINRKVAGDYLVTIKRGKRRIVKYAELIEYPTGNFTWKIPGEPGPVEIIATQKFPKPYEKDDLR